MQNEQYLNSVICEILIIKQYTDKKRWAPHDLEHPVTNQTNLILCSYLPSVSAEVFSAQAEYDLCALQRDNEAALVDAGMHYCRFSSGIYRIKASKSLLNQLCGVLRFALSKKTFAV